MSLFNFDEAPHGEEESLESKTMQRGIFIRNIKTTFPCLSREDNFRVHL